MAEPSLTEFADRLNSVLPAVIKGFSQRQAVELYKGKITLPQFLVLDFLSQKNDSRMTDMANFMKVTTAAMTGIVGRLVKYGYVSRAFDADDRRIIKVRLTDKGSDLLRRINRQRRRMIIDIFSQISEKERQDYLGILMHIHQILAQAEKSAKG
ncbi:MarR family winged helix-turn-helix transcriptional regulator [Candidatus Omnitrophota bacterium]